MATQAEVNHQPAGKGDQFTVSLSDPVPVGCTFEVWIDDRRVQPGDIVKGLRVVGFGATGTATFEAVKGSPNVTVTIRVRCRGRDDADYPVDIGKGWQHPPREAFDPDRGRPLPPPWDEDFAGPNSHRHRH